jgi:hypothetical protein
LWERGKEEKIMGYGTTHFCPATNPEAAKEIGNRAKIPRRICKEALSDHPGQCERSAGFRDCKAVRLFGRDGAQYDQEL